MPKLWWLAALGSLSCGGVVGAPIVDVNWVFINNSDSPVGFSALVGSQASGANVAAHARQYASSVLSGIEARTITTTISVSGTGIPVQTQQKSIALDGSEQEITITATWNGTTLTVTSGPSCSNNLRAAALRSSSTFGVGPSANTTCGPVWILEGVTNPTSANWSGNSQTGLVTGNGTLSLNFPQTVEPGETVTLGITFAGSVNWQGPGGPPIELTLKEFVGVGGVGYIANTTKAIGTANPTASGSVTVSPSYTFPSSNFNNKIEITIQASMNLATFFFAPDPVVTYRLSP